MEVLMRLKLLLLLITLLCISNAHGRSMRARVIPAASSIRPLIMQAGSPVFSATPTSVDFGPVAVGVSTPVFSIPPPFFTPIEISNTGTGSLTANFSFNSPEFAFDSVTNLPNPVTIAAASSVNGGLVFTPSAAGLRTGQLISTDNAAGSPHTVQLTGTGVNVPSNDFTVILDPAAPATITVKAGQTVTFTIWALAGPGLNTPISAFAGTQCTGGPNGTVCSLTPNGFFAISANVNTRQKLTVSVTPPVSSGALHRSVPLLWGLMCVSGILLVARRRVAWSTALLGSVIVLCCSLIACGGGSGGQGNTTPLSITVGQQVGAASVSHTLTVPLTVQ
jgi:plastocyanin